MNGKFTGAAIVSELRHGVLKIAIDRPAAKNALTPAMFLALTDYLGIAAADTSVNVVLLTGSYGTFTAGADIKSLQARPNRPYQEKEGTRFMQALATFDKPVVAAVNGTAIGIGVTLLLHCDLVYAATTARFRMPFLNLGLTPEFASTLLLPQMMGHTKAAELLLLGREFSADYARECGMVAAVLAPEELLAHAEQAARELAAKSSAAVQITKALLKKRARERVLQVLDEEGAEFSRRLQSQEAQAAFAAFINRQKGAQS